MTVTVGRPHDEVELKAVHDDDLIGYLDALGIRQVDGVLGHCKFCRDAVTEANLAAIFPLSGDIKLACDKAACLRGMQDLISEGRLKL